MQSDSHEPYKRRSKSVANEPDKNFCTFFLNTQSVARKIFGIFGDSKAAYVCHRNQPKSHILLCLSSVAEREWQNQTWWVISGAQFSLVPQVCKFTCVGTFVGSSGSIHVLCTVHVPKWMPWGDGTMICRFSGWDLQNCWTTHKSEHDSGLHDC